ncbi:MAG: 3-ketoacyl-ACP reductase [Lysobacterales bacterium]|jgi:NAD(P)-dependent dehydrogenase (short-subunit alcohol dehydrogenase family)|nr:MAG: 3-ketoacyl-ACP reductase [Xanthomonadales bacterium]
MPGPLSIELEGRRIAVTGAFGALGRTVVRTLVGAGARVAAIDLTGPPPGMNDDPAILPLFPIDLAEVDSATSAFARIGEVFGSLDGLCNLAGGFRWQRLDQGEPAAFDLMFWMNLRTAAVASTLALPMLADGRAAIVNIAALSALKAGEGMAAYAAAKAGVMKLTESLAEELKPRGIRVNAILPSIIDTPANRADMPKADFSRWVRPEEIAHLIAFLLSDLASGINGALIAAPGRL